MPDTATAWAFLEQSDLVVPATDIDAGHILAAIKARLLQEGARSVRCAVLVEKILALEKPARAGYVGLQIPDRFVFGCGMDAKNYCRNLPEIRAMKE